MQKAHLLGQQSKPWLSFVVQAYSNVTVLNVSKSGYWRDDLGEQGSATKLSCCSSIELRAPSQHCYLALLRAGRWRLLRICFFGKFRAWYSFCGRFNAGRLGGGLIVERDAVLRSS